jgi:hypothetical protein
MATYPDGVGTDYHDDIIYKTRANPSITTKCTRRSIPASYKGIKSMMEAQPEALSTLEKDFSTRLNYVISKLSNVSQVVLKLWHITGKVKIDGTTHLIRYSSSNTLPRGANALFEANLSLDMPPFYDTCLGVNEQPPRRDLAFPNLSF